MTSSRTLMLGLMLLAASDARAQGTIAGTLFDSLRANRSLGGATVTIAELGRYTQTDGRGRFHFDSVPGGHYTLSFFDSPLDSLGLAAPRVPVDVPSQGVVNVRLATPAPLSLLRILCGPAADTTSGAVVGTVRAVDDASAMAGAAVASRWTRARHLKSMRQRHVLTAMARSNGAGGYVLCRLPRDIPVDLRRGRGVAFTRQGLGRDRSTRTSYVVILRSAGRSTAWAPSAARYRPPRQASRQCRRRDPGHRGEYAHRQRRPIRAAARAGGYPVGRGQAARRGAHRDHGRRAGSDGWVSLDLALGRDVQALPRRRSSGAPWCSTSRGSTSGTAREAASS